jgi:hypothetical protein
MKFTDHSAGNPTAWFWSFPGGTPSVSTDQHPVVTYQEPGAHEVTLVVVNGVGESTITKACNTIYVSMPVADFTYTVSELQVAFGNLTQNATHYSWNFGDGTTSSELNPTHQYAKSGTYLVELHVDNDCSAHVYQQLLILGSVGTDEEQWLESFRLFPNPNTGVFTVEMLGKDRGKGEVNFTLMDALGRVMKRETADFRSGNLMQVFDYSDLPAAVYTLAIQNGEEVIYAKVVVQQ